MMAKVRRRATSLWIAGSVPVVAGASWTLVRGCLLLVGHKRRTTCHGVARGLPKDAGLRWDLGPSEVLIGSTVPCDTLHKVYLSEV